MNDNNELLFDILYEKKKKIKLYIEELKKSNDNDKSILVYNKQNELEFVECLIEGVGLSEDGILFLKRAHKDTVNEGYFTHKMYKCEIIKSLLKEYKNEYRKNYWNNKKLGLNGLFDNELFCDIIKKRINKCVNCNMVTRKKYEYLAAFLTELLKAMESSKEPLKTLKHKIKLYQKYKKSEFIEIGNKRFDKVEIIEQVLDEYKKNKISNGRM